MMRATVSAVLAAGMLAGAVMLGGAAAAPAGGQSVAAMKEQLAKLKAQEADLQAKIQAAEAPAAGTVPEFIKKLNTLPQNLWPVDGENDMKVSVRQKWIDDNIKDGVTYEFTGTVAVSAPTKVDEPGKPERDGIQVTLDCGKQMVWGKEKNLRIVTVIGNVKPEDALDWNEKTVVTVTGKSKQTGLFGNPIDVRMDVSEKK